MNVSDPDQALSAVPRTLRIAGGVVTGEGLIGIGVAIYLVIRALGGHQESFISGYGTALWFVLIFGGVLAGGLAIYRGRRWGRAIGVIAQILLIPVAWSLLTDSHLPVLGAPLLAVALLVLGLLFAPVSMQYLAAEGLPPDA
ncbi:membrane protein [Gordonia hirsuta]|uniref:membrane protein n=1 Tax=Gordonia hirsuta TaxID=53427 RepID=UPI000348A113|nr:membrane protein [Gordonia hirsuta]